MYDCDKAWNSMWEVYEKNGAIVALLADMNGDKYVKGEMVHEEWLDPGVSRLN